MDRIGRLRRMRAAPGLGLHKDQDRKGDQPGFYRALVRWRGMLCREHPDEIRVGKLDDVQLYFQYRLDRHHRLFCDPGLPQSQGGSHRRDSLTILFRDPSGNIFEVCYPALAG